MKINENESHSLAAPRAAGPLGRAFHVQRIMAVMDREECGPTLLAKRAGLSYATVHRILAAGVDMGAFERTPAGRYRLGPLAAQLGLAATVPRSQAAARRRILADLVQETDAAVCLIEAVTMLGGASSVPIDLVASEDRLGVLGATSATFYSTSRSLRAGAAGRVIAASLPRRLVHQLAAESLPEGRGPGAIEDPEEFIGAVARARRLRYAHSSQELWAGWDCVAAPVVWGGVLGAVVLAKPTPEMTGDITCDVGQVVAAAARLEFLLRCGVDELTVATLVNDGWTEGSQPRNVA